MEIRPPTPEDLDALLAFFERVPESERTFFKEPVLDRATVEGWLTSDRGRRGLAFDEAGRVVGYVAVVRLSGWSDHVGDVRLVVDPQRRTQGLGRALARWALLQAVDCGMTKLTVEVIDGSAMLVRNAGHGAEIHASVEENVGVEPAGGDESRAASTCRDHDGVLRDLVLLSHPVADSWSAMETAGIDDALRAPGG